MNKSGNTDQLRRLAAEMCPDLEDIIWYDSPVTRSTWVSGIETGKSVEFLSLCALVRAYREKGYEVAFPELYQDQPDLFYVRNVIPRQHAAQAGHDAAGDELLPLRSRFLAALTPRVVVSQENGEDMLIFREGHPFHFINHVRKYSTSYQDRPDFLLAEGRVNLTFPSDDEISFTYAFGSCRTEGIIRVMNSTKLPLIDLTHVGEVDVPISGIVECSVGKGRDRAAEQLETYSALCRSTIRPLSILVNGRTKRCGLYNVEILLSMTESDPAILKSSMVAGMIRFIERLGT